MAAAASGPAQIIASDARVIISGRISPGDTIRDDVQRGYWRFSLAITALISADDLQLMIGIII